MNLGENIYRLRVEKNMSQGDLAEALEVSRQSVSKWENNSAVPELEKLVKMSALFGVTLDELVGGEKAERPQQAPVPPVETMSHISGRKIAGVSLLCCAFVCFVTFTILGYLSEAPLLGVLLAFPFLVTGIVCLVCRNNVGFFCCWALFIPVWLLLFVIFARMSFVMGTMGYIVGAAMLILFGALVIWTFYKLYSGKIPMPKWGKILITVLLVCLFVLHAIMLLPVKDAGSVKDAGYEVTENAPVASVEVFPD